LLPAPATLDGERRCGTKRKGRRTKDFDNATRHSHLLNRQVRRLRLGETIYGCDLCRSHCLRSYSSRELTPRGHEVPDSWRKQAKYPPISNREQLVWADCLVRQSPGAPPSAAAFAAKRGGQTTPAQQSPLANLLFELSFSPPQRKKPGRAALLFSLREARLGLLFFSSRLPALVYRNPLRRIGRSNVLRSGTDQPVVAQLFHDMCRPARDARHHKQRGKQVHVDAQHVIDRS
jgi:hypothetical protein